jgi:hypothetical protein
VRLAQICDAVLSPNVPHSLRLQGILVGGICVVFQRQQAYLLGGSSFCCLLRLFSSPPLGVVFFVDGKENARS